MHLNCSHSIKYLKISPLIIGSVALTTLSPYIKADDSLSYEGGVTLIQQHSSESKVRSSTSLSADLAAYYQTRHGHWHLHLEGSTTPRDNGVANIIQDSNADSGSSLNNRDQGRLQISEFHYLFSATSKLNLTFGLVDATAYLDTANIMNDENKNFISPSLVNNPVIDFPDYVIGGALEYQLTPTLTSRLFLSSTHGMADNNRRDYGSLFEVNDDQKGLFSALEIGYAANQLFVNIGAWSHRGSHEALDNPQKTDLSNYGTYVSAGLTQHNHQYEVRAGVANPEVSAVSKFTALAYQYATQAWDLGIGYSYAGLSSKIDSHHDAQTAELYWKKRLGKSWAITPSVQWFKNPILESETLQLDSNIMAANIRVHYKF